MLSVRVGCKRGTHYLAVGTILAACWCVSATAGEAGDAPPWPLRDHYSFDGGLGIFYYDIARSEWKIEIRGLGDLIVSAQPEIFLRGRGRLAPPQLEFDRDEREAYSDLLGEGIRFRTVYRPHHGVVVRSTVTSFEEQVHLLVQIDVTNTSGTPIAVEAIRSAVIPPGALANPGGAIHLTYLKEDRGTVPGNEAHASLVRFEMEASGKALGMGVLQSDQQDSSVHLVFTPGRRSAFIESRFVPPRVLKPGQRLKADPIWISLTALDPSEVTQNYAWAQNAVTGLPLRHPDKQNWVTVAPGQSASVAARSPDPVEAAVETKRGARRRAGRVARRLNANKQVRAGEAAK